jgi:exosortase
MAPMRPPPYVRLWLIAALACAVALVYWPSTVFLYQKWTDTDSHTYTHGWLILVVCVVLILRSRREIATAPASPSRTALLWLLGAVVVWLVCYRGGVEGLATPLVPLIFWLAATAAFGWAVGRLLLFPVAYFYFAVPIWYGTPLKDLTVIAMRSALAVTGPPAQFTGGDVIHIPNGAFVIEEGCSGVHFMIVGLAVAALYGEQRRDSWRVRARQLALMAVLALVANWVRVYTVIEAGYLTNMQSYLVRVSHYGFGWCVFAAALFVFFWVAPLLEPETAVASAPTVPLPERVISSMRPELTGLVITLAVLLALPALSAGVRRANAAPTVDSGLLDPSGDWRAALLDPGSAWRPLFPGAEEFRQQAFRNSAGDTVEVLTVAYREQRQGVGLAAATSSLFGEQLQANAEQLVGSAAGVFGETAVTDANGAPSLIWWRYDIAGRKLVNPLMERLWYGINAVVWNPPASLIALRAVCAADCNSARRTLRSFIAGSDLR